MKSKKGKLIASMMIATTILSAVGGATTVVLNSPVVHAAQNISGNAVADETSERSITIWKYQVKDSSELGEHGTGMATAVDKTPLAGIKFKVQKVKALNNKSLVDPLKVTVGTDYEVTEEKEEITTQADGSAKIVLGTGTQVDGIYLITELADDREVSPSVAKPVDPFFVYVPQTKRDDRKSLIYDVEVQPKNILESLLKPNKTIEDGKGHSIKAGEKFKWEATASIPNGLYTIASQDMKITPVYDKDGNVVADIDVAAGAEIFANYFTITDELNEELLLDDVTVQVKKGIGEWTELDFNTDYKITVNAEKKEVQPVEDHSEGQKEVVMELTEAGMKKIAVNKDNEIRVNYTTHTAVDYNGTISNHFDVAFLTPGLKPVIVPSEEDPEYYVGGFDLIKKGEDTQDILANAEFHIALTEEDAKAGKYLAEDGLAYATEEAATAAGTKLMKAVTNDEGLAEFNGLALKCFEDTNGNGKQDLDEPTFAEEDIKQSYWVVETKAPEGYELLKGPQEVEVSLSTTTDDVIELEVVDKPKTDLPFTGGTGTTLLVAIALGAITIGTTAIVIDKKRRHA